MLATFQNFQLEASTSKLGGSCAGMRFQLITWASVGLFYPNDEANTSFTTTHLFIKSEQEPHHMEKITIVYQVPHKTFAKWLMS
jgi:hypothetical protein